MFSYSPFHTHLFSRQPCEQCESNGSGSTAANRGDYVAYQKVADFFFISHPPAGRKEGSECERVMYFCSPEDSWEEMTLNRKTDICGFAEAVIGFTNSFTNGTVNGNCAPPPLSQEHHDYKYRYVNSANSREVVLIVENGNFILGYAVSRKKCKASDYFPHSPTLKVMLIRLYESYRLLYGTLTEQHAALGVDAFRAQLNRYFSPTLSMLNLSKIPLMDLFTGVEFMPLKSGTQFLEVECMMTRLMEEFPCVRHTAFLYQQQLIQHNVEKLDLVALFHFLADNLIAYSLQKELQPEISSLAIGSLEPDALGKKGEGKKGEKRLSGLFIRGMGEEDDYWGESTEGGFPRVFLHSSATSSGGGTTKPYELLAYRVLNATVCLFIEEGESLKGVAGRSNLLEQLAEFFDQAGVSALASNIGEGIASRATTQSDTPYHYIYFNSDSLSVRSSFPSSSSIASTQISTAPVLPHAVSKLAYETFDHFAAPNGTKENTETDFAQVLVKADSDWWLALKQSSGRILALFIPHWCSSTHQSSVADAHECAEKIIKADFEHIFVS